MEEVEGSSGTHRIITSRSDFLQALREGFALAAAQGCRELLLSDPDFADWPLGELEVLDHLTRWAFAHRKLTMLGGHFDEVSRRHARFAAWRRQWSHIVECRSPDSDDERDMPTVLLAPGLLTLKLLNRAQSLAQYRASWSTDEGDAVRTREHLDALLQRSVEAFPATTLGL
jgi:hypothetical protein